jgi:hypothetical protein
MGEHMNCLDMSQYGTLLIVDPEEEFFAEEVEFSVLTDEFTFLEMELSSLPDSHWINCTDSADKHWGKCCTQKVSNFKHHFNARLMKKIFSVSLTFGKLQL